MNANQRTRIKARTPRAWIMLGGPRRRAKALRARKYSVPAALAATLDSFCKATSREPHSIVRYIVGAFLENGFAAATRQLDAGLYRRRGRSSGKGGAS